MTRIERIVLRHQIAAAVRRRVSIGGGSRHDPRRGSSDPPGAWMPECRLPKNVWNRP